MHFGVYYPNGEHNIWCTTIYAFNTLGQRKNLWRDIERIYTGISSPWSLMGDFNNFLQAQDRIGGNIVREYEYANLVEMMMKTELFDK